MGKSRKAVSKYIQFSLDVTEGAIKLIKIKSPAENSLDAECFESEVLIVSVWKAYGARDHFLILFESDNCSKQLFFSSCIVDLG